MSMLPFDDPRWQEMAGGYKVLYNPTNALRSLERGEDVWDELWNELHHQGDVGLASYAAVPHLVRIGKSLTRRDWNFYGLVSVIEIERHRKLNPPMPAWLNQSYQIAWLDILRLGLQDLLNSTDENTIKTILGTIALAKGLLQVGALIVESDQSEIAEMLDHYKAWSQFYDE